MCEPAPGDASLGQYLQPVQLGCEETDEDEVSEVQNSTENELISWQSLFTWPDHVTDKENIGATKQRRIGGPGPTVRQVLDF